MKDAYNPVKAYMEGYYSWHVAVIVGAATLGGFIVGVVIFIKFLRGTL